MAAERQDNIWAEDWPLEKANVLAERYANATRAGLAPRARELARNAARLSELGPVRELYHRSRDIEKALAGWAASCERRWRATASRSWPGSMGFDM